ncbi:MAG: glycosyltransferase family 2 protein [Phycisphaeraceae bacterium]
MSEKTASNHRDPHSSVAAPDEHKAALEPRDPRAEALAAELEPARQPPGDWPAVGSVPVSVLVPTLREAANIGACLRHLSWAEQIVVVDSHSTDMTGPIAQAFGAELYQFTLSPAGWPKKRNWALAHVPWRHEWVLVMDADEHVTPALAREIEAVVTRESDDGCTGYWVNRRFMFLGRWIRHCGYYPSWNLRLFKHRVGRYERIGELHDTDSGDNEIHEHVVLAEGKAGRLRHDFLHYAYPDLSTWVEKHNRYSSWEAQVMQAGLKGGFQASLFGGPIARRRWLKQKAMHLPMRPTLRFLYHYVFRLGFLDGYPGYCLARLLGWYEFLSIAKYRELRRKRRDAPPSSEDDS